MRMQLSRFLSELSQLLHLDTEMLSMDTDAATEALMNHVGRLARNESTSVADCRTHIRGLQRKLKSNKEILDRRVSLRTLSMISAVDAVASLMLRDQPNVLAIRSGQVVITKLWFQPSIPPPTPSIDFCLLLFPAVIHIVCRL